MIIYIGMLMTILYYYGATQWCALKLGWLFQVSMGTTAIESLAVASNIFLSGVSYAPLVTHSRPLCVH